MTLITIQNKKVLDRLKSGKIYTSDFDHICDNVDEDDSYKFKSYRALMNHYDYYYPPIFCAVLDKVTSFNGTRDSRSNVILKLSVPDVAVKLHRYTTWHIMTLKTALKNYDSIILEECESLDTEKIDKGEPIQAVIPYIKPEWLLEAYKVPKDFIANFIFSRLLLECDFNQDKIF